MFIKNVLEEYVGASVKFPSNQNQTVAMVEEVGELAQALLDNQRGKKSELDVYAEAVQVAAMAARIAIQGDKAFPYEYTPNLSSDFKATEL